MGGLYSMKIITFIILAYLLTDTPQLLAKTGEVKFIYPLVPDNGLSESSQQYSIQYSSVSGVDGRSYREDTAAIFIPSGPSPEGGWPVIVWAHGTVGIARNCAPSLNIRNDRDRQYLNTWLSLGFAIVAPDYPGLGSDGLHRYFHSREVAWSILDGIRAALKAFPLKNEIILVGQYQGAHAAFSAAGHQQLYAKELNIQATILTGVPYFTKETITTSGIFLPIGKDANDDSKTLPYLFYLYFNFMDKHSQKKYYVFS